MSLEKITTITGRGVFVPGDDLDTDRIIPARFMKCVTFDGLGEYLFYDVRKNDDGSNREHPLNEDRFKGANLLISGANFGCGSSREHAPQAIWKYGFRAVIAQSFAEIFFGNCTTLSMPCVCASSEDIKRLSAAIEADPAIEITIDLLDLKLNFGEESLPITMPESAREALITGRWDPIADLLSNQQSVEDRLSALQYAMA